ncbi:hypothetical protein [Cellulomonas palmilytica]|uniref:hypothetical protein n=1 Tax=Cellulomonas palmilytica TaxID=2608402 RepID=UPI001F397209|nr:hypothetical protein [Cellulomonas palmilytica]UJP40354.1 hypothetical protein F1D97_02130 [Cellulomonas palmilytica]
MSTPAGGPTPDIVAGLEAFSRRAEASLARLRDLQSQIDAIVPPQLPHAVHAEMDADGLLVELTIQQDLPADELEHEIGLAITDATRRRPAPDVAKTQATFRAAARGGDLDLGRILDQVLGGLDPSTEPAAHRNARNTVEVSAQAGVVRRVRCDHTWLASTSRAGVAAEVLATVNEAVTASTTPGRA